MLTPSNVTMAQYNAAILNGNEKYVRIVFPTQDITLTGDDISADGGLIINQILNAEQDLVMGRAVMAETIIRFINSSTFVGFDWTEEFHIDFGVKINNSINWVTVGYFKGKKPKRTVGVNIIEFTAYDRMRLFDELADDFIAGLTFPCTMADIYTALCTFVGITSAAGDEMQNAMAMEYSENPFVNGVTCRDILSYIAEANCCYAKITADGYVTLKWFEEQNYTLTEDNHFGVIVDEVATPVIDTVRISSTEDEDAGSVYPVGSNDVIYNIIDNPLLLCLGTADRTTVMADILTRLDAFGAYTPASVSAIGNWMVETGDIISAVHDGNQTVNIPVFVRGFVFDGSCGDVYESTGSADREMTPTTREQYEQGGKLGRKYSVVSGVDIDEDGVTVSGGKFVKIKSGGVFEVESQNLDVDSDLGYILFKETEGGALKRILIGHGGAATSALTTILDIANNAANPYSSVSFQDMYCSDPARHKSVSMRLMQRDFGDGLGNLLCITGRTGIYNQQTHEEELDTDVINFFGNIFKGVAMYADDLHCLFPDIDSPITWDSSVVNVSSCDCVMTGNGSFKYMKLTISLKNNINAWTVIGTLNAALVPHKTISGLAFTIGNSPAVSNIQIQTNGNIRIRSGNASTLYYWDAFYPHNAFVRE